MYEPVVLPAVRRGVRGAARAAAAILGAAALVSTVPAAHACAAGPIATVARPALVHLGAAPPIAAGARRLVVGRLVGMEPPAQGVISIQLLLRPACDAAGVPVGRFSPFPVVRIVPGQTAHPQPFSAPVDRVVPAAGGGDWYVELRIEPDPAAAPAAMQAVRLQFGEVAFSAD